MIELTQEELKQHFSEPIFGQIAETADALGLECYVVGGYVRDIFLQRPSKDIDVVVVGSGIAMAEALLLLLKLLYILYFLLFPP